MCFPLFLSFCGRFNALLEMKSEGHFGFWNVKPPVSGHASSDRDSIFTNDRRTRNLVTCILIRALRASCRESFCTPSSSDSLSLRVFSSFLGFHQCLPVRRSPILVRASSHLSEVSSAVISSVGEVLICEKP